MFSVHDMSVRSNDKYDELLNGKRPTAQKRHQKGFINTKIRSNQEERSINAGLKGELLQDPTKVHHIHFLVSLFLSLVLWQTNSRRIKSKNSAM